MSEFEPLLPYDGYGMGLLAGTPQEHARTLDSTGSELAVASGGITFDGPAGTQVTGRLPCWSSALTSAAQQVQAAAGQLAAAAQQVADENAAITRHNQTILAT